MTSGSPLAEPKSTMGHRLRWAETTGRLALGVALIATVLGLSAGTASATTVTVAAGQDLTSIAKANGTTVAALEAANGITNPSLVYAGAVLQIPGTSGAAPLTTVTVMPGEDLTSIAKRFDITLAVLEAANGITNPNLVKAGTVLQIPGSAAGPAAPASAPVPTTVVVSPGQDLYSIATHNGTTVAALVAANDITNPNYVAAGTLLHLPSTWVLSDLTTAAASTTGATGADAGFPAALVANPTSMALVPAFTSAANAYNLPVSLLEAMCWWESGWQANVVSPTGAIGECQLEPYTTAFVNSVLLGGADLNADLPVQNITLAAAYLHYLLTLTGGSESQALAGYYQGLLSVQQSGLLASTQTYVQGILAYAAMFATG